jgi:catechol 2,3-dioxygenase-like lactoylglutathione lyase family enzyme
MVRYLKMPQVRRVLETVLYVEDLDRARSFYETAIGLKVIYIGEHAVALDGGEGTVFLLFQRGSTAKGSRFEGGWIPSHDGTGETHFAFAIDRADLDDWRARLDILTIEIESEVTWPRGGTSVYFRDPDGHSVELATPGVWKNY